MNGSIDKFLRRQPKSLIWWITGWLLLAGFHWILSSLGVYDGGVYTEPPSHPRLFPMSIFYGPRFNYRGLPAVFGFGLLLAYCIRRAAVLSAWRIWAAALALIILGNLGQGGLYDGFLAPLSESDIQYYHAALEISNWQQWLADFNTAQEHLLPHTKTHPPFAVLLHVSVLAVAGGRLWGLALVMTLLSAASVAVWHAIAGQFDVPSARRNLLTVLFAVVPAVNIYTAVSLDGVVLTAASLFLLGLVRQHRRPRPDLPSICLAAAGFAAVNLLSYGGVFLLGTGALLVVLELLAGRRTPGAVLNLAFALAAAVMLFGSLALFLNHFAGYDHLQGFLTASHIENPMGFRGTAEPAVYAMTRLENVSEILLFFSFGCLTRLFRTGPDACIRTAGATPVTVMAAGCAVLLAMFAAGAFKTGETARGCLFIYPYLMLPFVGMDTHQLRDMTVLAGIQTGAMQLFGDYFW